MNRLAALVLGCMIFCSPSFAQHKKPESKSAAQKKATHFHYGIASYYANKFEGRKTATGDIFSQKKMTGASNIIALNTWVKVTNLHNKRTTVVKITDRMHHGNKRLIDLSRKAANKLGYANHGLAWVKVEVLGKKRPADWPIEPIHN